MRVEALLRDKAAAGKRQNAKPGQRRERNREQKNLEKPCGRSADEQDKAEDEKAQKFALLKACVGPVEMAFQQAGQSATPGDRMANGAKKPIGVAEGGFKRERQKGKGEGLVEIRGHAR